MAPTMQSLTEGLATMQIEAFFRETPGVTQSDCHKWAECALGQPVRATALQGATSYTVEAVDNGRPVDRGGVVQFRSPENALNIRSIEYAQQAYGPRFVQCPRDGGILTGLQAYIMDNVGGVSVYLARQQLRADGGYLLQVAVTDFAHRPDSSPRRGIARQPQCRRPTAPPYTPATEMTSSSCRGLPTRWNSMLGDLLQTLPALFADEWPMVPNHTDLLENNIHVNPDMGHLTGVCDWADAVVSPFGKSFEGLESLLGESTRTGWSWVDGSAELRRGFWQAFSVAVGPEVPLERVKAARLVGCFLKFGFKWTDAQTRVPVAEGSKDLAFLEAITLNLDVAS